MSGKSKAAMIAQLSKARRTGERLSEKVKVRTAAARGHCRAALNSPRDLASTTPRAALAAAAGCA
jgi:hypothetical protein